MFYPIKSPDGTDFYPKAPDGRDGNWRTRPTALDDNHIHWEKRKERWIPYEVIYFHEIKQKDKIVKERTIYYDLATTTDATNEQKDIFGEKVFDTSKPLNLIERLVLLSTTPDSLVLDSFAGSGTTAHAVLALNKEDGGNRKFILIECEDYADTITAERVRRVVNGVPNTRDTSLHEGLGGSFTYCTLGEPMNMEGMLTGDALPTYETLAAFLLHTASGATHDESHLRQKNDNGLFCSEDKMDYYMLYKPDLEYLRSNEAMLTQDLAERIRDASCRNGKKATVYAPGKYISQKDLTPMGITFCQLPHALHER